MAEDALQPARMPRREQPFQQLLPDEDRDQPKRHGRPQSQRPKPPILIRLAASPGEDKASKEHPKRRGGDQPQHRRDGTQVPVSLCRELLVRVLAERHLVAQLMDSERTERHEHRRLKA